MTVAVMVVTFGVLAFGLFVVAMLVLTSIRQEKVWAEPSLVLTEEQQKGLEDPAMLGAPPPDDDAGGAETLGVSTAQFRTRINFSAGGSGL